MRRLVSMVLVAGLFLAGCGDAKPAATGTITVFAATSLTAAFTDIGTAFEAANPNSKVTFNFAASSALAQQIFQGATPDVFASADTKNVPGGAPIFAHNRLVIVTKPGNPTRIEGLADLLTTGVVSLCDSTVPCGDYARQALTRAAVSLDESRVTRAPNVAAALSAVTDGDAVAAIVYVTDAKAAGARVQTVAIPDATNVIADYPIAALRNSPTARAFVAFVRGPDGQRILRRYGFVKP